MKKMALAELSVMVLVFGMTVISCGDKDTVEQNITGNPFVGTWLYMPHPYESITFNSDLTARWVFWSIPFPGIENETGNIGNASNGTYSYSGGNTAILYIWGGQRYVVTMINNSTISVPQTSRSLLLTKID